MARSSRARRPATREWPRRSWATSEAVGIRVGPSTDDQEDDNEEGEESNGPGSGSSIPATEIGLQEGEHGSETTGGSTSGNYQTACEEAETEET